MSVAASWPAGPGTGRSSRCRRAPAAARRVRPRCTPRCSRCAGSRVHGRNSPLKDELARTRRALRRRLRRRRRRRAGRAVRRGRGGGARLGGGVDLRRGGLGPELARGRRPLAASAFTGAEPRTGASGASASRRRSRSAVAVGAAATAVVVGRGVAVAFAALAWRGACVRSAARGACELVAFGANSCASGPAHTAARVTPAQPTATLVPSPTLSAVPAPTAVPLASAASCASRAAAPPPRPTTAPTRAASRSHAPISGTPITSSSPRARSA